MQNRPAAFAGRGVVHAEAPRIGPAADVEEEGFERRRHARLGGDLVGDEVGQRAHGGERAAVDLVVVDGDAETFFQRGDQ